MSLDRMPPGTTAVTLSAPQTPARRSSPVGVRGVPGSGWVHAGHRWRDVPVGHRWSNA